LVYIKPDVLDFPVNARTVGRRPRKRFALV
jgi:hypothetical protein